MAEQAGMYKQCQQIFRRIETIIAAPDVLRKREEQGLIIVQKKGSNG